MGFWSVEVWGFKFKFVNLLIIFALFNAGEQGKSIQ